MPRKASAYHYAGAKLEEHWRELHKGDREPFPSDARIRRLASAHPELHQWVLRNGGAAKVASALQDAWRAFHAGEFLRAMESGEKLDALGAIVANKAAAIHTLYREKSERKRLEILREAIERGERALERLPDEPNLHYTLALVLGRYSQRISILQAVASGYAGRIRHHLEKTLELEPKHAEAHIALGLYHAELVRTLGSLAARFTHGASEGEAIRHFRQALKLAPDSPIARVEYAHGLRLLDGDTNRKEIRKLCAEAAAHEPRDAMEEMDVERARAQATRR